jgi:hypothetical protein
MSSSSKVLAFDDSARNNETLNNGIFLFALINSLHLVEKDCGKKFASYRFSNNTFITLNDVLVYNASSATFEKGSREGYYLLTDNKIVSVFEVVREVVQGTEYILVCGHKEKKENLQPLLSYGDYSKNGAFDLGLVLVLDPGDIGLEGALRLPGLQYDFFAASTTLKAWHTYMAAEFEKTEMNSAH